MSVEWMDKKDEFEVVDVRELRGNFLPMVLKKAGSIAAGEGLCVVQSFEPIPLYSALADLGFEHLTEKVSDAEYRAYFYRAERKEPSTPVGMDVPLKPLALLNVKGIDNRLAEIMVQFWDFVWGREKPAIDQNMRYLLSLANGVGAGRFRQATRELVKAYAGGVTVAELDDLFSMFLWNQGMGTFASEIGPSSLFSAYMLIKKLESEEKSRDEVMQALVERFGEKSPEVGVLYKKK
jgi:hypothetical protein